MAPQREYTLTRYLESSCFKKEQYPDNLDKDPLWDALMSLLKNDPEMYSEECHNVLECAKENTYIRAFLFHITISQINRHFGVCDCCKASDQLFSSKLTTFIVELLDNDYINVLNHLIDLMGVMHAVEFSMVEVVKGLSGFRDWDVFFKPKIVYDLKHILYYIVQKKRYSVRHHRHIKIDPERHLFCRRDHLYRIPIDLMHLVKIPPNQPRPSVLSNSVFNLTILGMIETKLKCDTRKCSKISLDERMTITSECMNIIKQFGIINYDQLMSYNYKCSPSHLLSTVNLNYCTFQDLYDLIDLVRIKFSFYITSVCVGGGRTLDNPENKSTVDKLQECEIKFRMATELFDIDTDLYVYSVLTDLLCNKPISYCEDMEHKAKLSFNWYTLSMVVPLIKELLSKVPLNVMEMQLFVHWIYTTQYTRYDALNRKLGGYFKAKIIFRLMGYVSDTELMLSYPNCLKREKKMRAKNPNMHPVFPAKYYRTTHPMSLQCQVGQTILRSIRRGNIYHEDSLPLPTLIMDYLRGGITDEIHTSLSYCF